MLASRCIAFLISASVAAERAFTTEASGGTLEKIFFELCVSLFLIAFFTEFYCNDTYKF